MTALCDTKALGVYVFYEPENDGGLPLLGQHEQHFYLFSRIEARGVDDCCTSVGIYLDVLGYLLIFIADNKELYGLAGTVHHLVEHEAAYV